MKQFYTTKDVMVTFDIPMPRLRMWLLNDFITPSCPSEGQGKKASFSRSDFYGIAVFIKLLEKGLKREEAAKYVKEFQNSEIELQYSNYIVFITIKKDGKTIIRTIRPSGIDPFGLIMWPSKISMLDYPSMGEIEYGEFLWEDMLVINFGLIRAFVDAKLE